MHAWAWNVFLLTRAAAYLGGALALLLSLLYLCSLLVIIGCRLANEIEDNAYQMLADISAAATVQQVTGWVTGQDDMHTASIMQPPTMSAPTYTSPGALWNGVTHYMGPAVLKAATPMLMTGVANAGRKFIFR